MDFLPYFTLSRLFLADLLPLKTEWYLRFSPNCKKDTAFAATGRTIWSLLEQCKLPVSQEQAPCIAPPSNLSLPPQSWKAFHSSAFWLHHSILTDYCVCSLSVYRKHGGQMFLEQGRSSSLCLACRVQEVLLRSFCPFEEQLRARNECAQVTRMKSSPECICMRLIKCCLSRSWIGVSGGDKALMWSCVWA